jgi:hypothetical protein
MTVEYRDADEMVREVARTSPLHPCYDCGGPTESLPVMLCPHCHRFVCVEGCYEDHTEGRCLRRVGASHKE